MREPDYPWAIAILLAVPAAAYGAVIAWFALAFSGGGDGWNGAWISSVAVVLVPLLAVSWVYRRRWLGRLLSMLILLGGLVANILLLASAQEEATYTRRVASNHSGAIATWASLWLLWQLAALYVLFYSLAVRRANAQRNAA